MQIEYQLSFCHSTIVMLEGKLLLKIDSYTHYADRKWTDGMVSLRK